MYITKLTYWNILKIYLFTKYTQSISLDIYLNFTSYYININGLEILFFI